MRWRHHIYSFISGGIWLVIRLNATQHGELQSFGIAKSCDRMTDSILGRTGTNFLHRWQSRFTTKWVLRPAGQAWIAFLKSKCAGQGISSWSWSCKGIIYIHTILIIYFFFYLPECLDIFQKHKNRYVFKFSIKKFRTLGIRDAFEMCTTSQLGKTQSLQSALG